MIWFFLYFDVKNRFTVGFFLFFDTILWCFFFRMWATRIWWHILSDLFLSFAFTNTFHLNGNGNIFCRDGIQNIFLIAGSFFLLIVGLLRICIYQHCSLWWWWSSIVENWINRNKSIERIGIFFMSILFVCMILVP